jgi:hypothetical protein
MIRWAIGHQGLPVDPLRIEAHADRDAYTFDYPGYSPVTITGLELLQSGDPQGYITARVIDMLRTPVI